jgi:deoxyribodipyrimidine photo-lyase
VSFNQARLRRLNTRHIRGAGDYVLYWMQLYRRLERNHALDYALRCARELRKPLVIYEGLRLDYPWASRRLHRFALEGMSANRARALDLGLDYWPFVETPQQPARGLVRRLAARAALVVTDDFPGFIVPRQSEALAKSASVPVYAVDGNGLVPLSLLGPAVYAAAHLRPRLHKAFAEAWAHRASAAPDFDTGAARAAAPPFEPWQPPADLEDFVAGLPLDASVPAVRATPGGTPAARERLDQFVRWRLRGYAEHRSQPNSPERGHSSGLSPYLHFGHISVEEVVERVLGEGWTPGELRIESRGKRQGFFGDDADVNGFLDQALTWRDTGFNWHWSRRADAETLVTALPEWAFATLQAHASDRRAYVYTLDEWESGATHDELWNAAQRELAATGTMHNYLRMLWGKKVIEWSRSPSEAYATLVQLNNKYALDGRDPNSYTGILWCFGLFDRPWAPERPVFGGVRYMSSDNTARKFKLGPYYEYVTSLPTIADVRAGGQA